MAIRSTNLRGRPRRIKRPSTRVYKDLAFNLNRIIRPKRGVYGFGRPVINRAVQRFVFYATLRKGIIGFLGAAAGEVLYRKLVYYLSGRSPYSKFNKGKYVKSKYGWVKTSS